MSGSKTKGVKGAPPLSAGLKPTVSHDNVGDFIIITCGSLAGNLYLSKLDESNKSQSKCIVYCGKWYSPPEFETLAGKKARKWKQSLHHQGKPLSQFSFCFQGCSQGGQSVLSAGSQNTNVSCSTLICNVASTQLVSDNNTSPDMVNSVGTSCNLFIVDTVLSFVKAYRLKGDLKSLKSNISERFCGASVSAAKKLLWDSCDDAFRALNLPYQQRRDSDKRKQLTADIEDLIMAFDALDSSHSIPPIYCEASDLYKLPPISLDPLAEQVENNCQILGDLKCIVERLESKFSSLMTSASTSRDHSSDQQCVSNSYANSVTSFIPPAVTTSLSPSTSATKPPQSTVRETNLILFGLSETHSLIQSKEIIDDMLEFLAGKPVQIRDMFRLGKNNRSSTASDLSRPRPILIKLSMAWDRKLVLLRKRNLREFRIKRLFIREDLPPEIRQQNSSRMRTEKTSARSPGKEPFVPTSPSSALAQSRKDQISDLMVDVAQKSDTVSLRSRRDSSQSISSTHIASENGSSSPSSPSSHSSRSVSPCSSSSTLVQEPPCSH